MKHVEKEIRNKMPLGKLIVLFVIAAVFVAFFYFDLDRYANLESLKSGISDLQARANSQPFQSGSIALLLYILVTALSLPGAAIVTLGIGAVFGVLWGVIIASFASSIGATLAFLLARYVFRDAVQNKYGHRLASINHGIQTDGEFYLFTLRLVPLFPFFLINLLMGLTPIRVWTFYWVSQVGMFAGTVVFVNAGTQLAKLESLSGIFSIELIVSFTLIGVFPLIAKIIVKRIKHARQK